MNFSGVIVPLITPFNEDLSLDLEGVRWLVNYLVTSGVHGVFPSSTTGEFPHLRKGEVVELVKAVVDAAEGRSKVLPGITANYSYDCVELGRELLDLGVDGFIIAPPYYFKVGSEGLVRHFSLVASKLDAPIIIYNIPETTGINIPVEVYLKLAQEFSNIVGTKVTNPNFTYLRRLVAEVKSVRKDFSVLTGLDDQILPALMIGCDGGVVGLANVAPKLYVDLINSWRSGDVAKALEAYRKVVKLVRVYDLTSSVPSGVKAVLHALGAPVKPYVRPPLKEEPKELAEELAKMIESLGICQIR